MYKKGYLFSNPPTKARQRGLGGRRGRVKPSFTPIRWRKFGLGVEDIGGNPGLVSVNGRRCANNPIRSLKRAKRLMSGKVEKV